ncbi:hypothetical protein D3C85_934150 [compost metagenome]
MRGVRAVGLVLVDKRRSGVLGFLQRVIGRAEDPVRPGTCELSRAGQDQEIGRAAFHVQRIVRLQRDEHDFIAALGDQVQPVIEELAEEGEPGVERRGKAFIRGGVGYEEDFLVIGGTEYAIQPGADDRSSTTIGFHGRRVIGGLVDNQVADGPRLGVDNHAAALVGSTVFRRAEERVEQARKEVVRRTEFFLAQHQMVEGTIDGPQAPGHLRVGQERRQIVAGRMGFSDENLLENELEVRLDEVGHFVYLNPTAISQAESRPRGSDSTFLRRKSMKPGKSKSRPNPPSLGRSSVPTKVICPFQHRRGCGGLTQAAGGP